MYRIARFCLSPSWPLLLFSHLISAPLFASHNCSSPTCSADVYTRVSNSYSQVGFLETILYCGFSLDKDELKTALFPFFNVGRDEPRAIDLGLSAEAGWKWQKHESFGILLSLIHNDFLNQFFGFRSWIPKQCPGLVSHASSTNSRQILNVSAVSLHLSPPGFLM